MNGGYYMVDCKGLDLTANSSQTISGIFAELKNAIKSGKPVFGYNCVWGANDDAPLSPICFFIQQWSESLIVCTSSILKVDVTDADGCTITDLTA